MIVRRLRTGKAGLLLAAAALAVSGCNQATSAHQHVAPVSIAAQLRAGERVSVLTDDGTFALIQTSAGPQGYLPSGLLKHRNTAQKMRELAYTHQVVQDAPCLQSRPAEVAWPEPRTLQDIDAEETALNGLFMTEKSHREVIAPRSSPLLFVDEVTGEPCWAAFECTHPQCPGPRTQNRPHALFIHPDLDSRNHAYCPHCLPERDLTLETDAQRVQWLRYVRLYELPELQRRRSELDGERRRFIRAKQHKSRPAPGSEIK